MIISAKALFFRILSLLLIIAAAVSCGDGGILAGQLDETFGGTGWVAHGSATGPDSYSAGCGIALDSSGRILVAGFSRTDPTDSDMVIWRFRDDGALDTSFGGTGWVTHHDAAGGDGQDGGNDIEVDASDRIVVTGSSLGPGGDLDVTIWRYLEDGSLDASFGGRGWVVRRDTVAPGHDEALAMSLDTSGRILVLGVSGHETVLWRTLEDGLPDLTFGGQGWVTDPSGPGVGFDALGKGIAVDASGQIFVAGYDCTESWECYPTLMIGRYQDDGQGGPIFRVGPNGKRFDTGRAITVDADGRLLVASSSIGTVVPGGARIWRIRADGTPDTSFGHRGRVFEEEADPHAIARDSLGGVLIAGRTNGPRPWDMGVWRYLPHGDEDKAFGDDGFVRFDLGGDEFAWDIVLDAQGRILVTGGIGTYGVNLEMAVWRIR